MNKKLKWGLVALALVALAGWGVYSQLPKTNEDLAAADKVVKTTSRKSTLNVNAIVVRPQTISDEIYINGSLLPDDFCPITMVNDDRLLIASHIKPWAVSTPKEQVDPNNGFMLSPLYDALFDKGFITFTDDRHMKVSNWLSPRNQERLHMKDDEFCQRLPINDERKKYLEYHRKMVFKG